MPRWNRPLWRLLALLSVLLLVVGACGDDDDEATTGGETEDTTEDDGGGGGDGKEIKFAYVGPLTGDAANLGILIRDGAKTAIEEANEAGGDYTFVLEEFDTQGDPAQATTVKDEYINDEDIIAIIGPAFSGETKAVIPALEEAGLPMVSASATNKDLPNVVPDSKVFHRIIPDDTLQGKGIGEFIAGLEAETVVFVHDNSEYGKGLATDTETALKAAGGSVAATEVVDPKAQDFSATVNNVKAKNPDAIFYSGYYQEAGRFRKQLVDAGVDATFISGDGSLDVGFIEAAGAAGEGALIGCPCNLPTEASTGKLGDLYKKYKEIIGKEPGIYSPEAYDAASILIEGVNAGNDTRETLLKYLEEDFTSFEGASKTVEFQENGNVTATDVYVFEVKGGKFVPREG